MKGTSRGRAQDMKRTIGPKRSSAPALLCCLLLRAGRHSFAVCLEQGVPGQAPVCLARLILKCSLLQSHCVLHCSSVLGTCMYARMENRKFNRIFSCGQNVLNLRCGRIAFQSTIRFKNTGGGWQPQPHSGTLFCSVSLRLHKLQ